MKRHLPLAALLIFVFTALCYAQAEATPSPSPKPKKPRVTKTQLQHELTEMESSLWEAWKNKDLKPFEVNLAADSVMIGDMGVGAKNEIAQAIKGCEIKSYKLSDWKMSKINTSAALLTYKAWQDGSCAGTTLPSTVWASSIWVKRKDVWVGVFHQETPAK